MQMKISSSELKQLIQYFADVLGEEWLKTQTVRYKAAYSGFENSMPIIQWFAIAERALKEGRQADYSALQLARVSRSLLLLRKAAVVGTEQRIDCLRSDNKDKVFSTIQEIVTATSYLEAGHGVQFIDEADEKRPDLLIDGNVEVECKFKVHETVADRRRYDLYNLLERRTRSAIEAAQYVSGV